MAGLSGRFVFTQRRRFVWKTAILAATTLALIPVLLLKNTQWAMWYLIALVAVHVVGVVVVVVGVKRYDIAPDKRGMWIRIVGIAILIGLLYLVAKGLSTDIESLVFWGALFAIWFLHTAGLALLHIKGKKEAAACPFV